jgi:hypothetical protein
MEHALKKHNTIGCCGIDCGLCPRFHTKGDSVCPGCGGLNFKEKHPSCGFVSCCVVKKGLEVCSDCNDYACSRFDSERSGKDSFVTHKKVFMNLDFIKSYGMDCFLEQQRIRNDILTDFLTNYDDGRSKSFFCICCALLPLVNLEETIEFMKDFRSISDLGEKNKLLRSKLQSEAVNLNLDIKLNNR